MATLSWLEAGTIGLIQGVSELFPVSSLAHSILIPALIGGSWASDLSVSAPESPYLAFIVGLHVATAIALIVFFRREWARIVVGLVTSIRDRQVRTPDQRLAWLLIVATIPVGIAGLLLEHTFRTVLGRPVPAAVFLIVNGLLLAGAERLRRRGPRVRPRRETGTEVRTTGEPRTAGDGESSEGGRASDLRLAGLGVGRATTIGAAEILALLPGISRSGAAMAAGMVRGLSHEDAARFSFLLATPVILAAGALKLPDLAGPLGAGIRPQVLFGSVLSGLGAYVSVRFLTRYFQTRTLTPFAIYCVAAGLVSLVVLAVRAATG